MNNPETLKVIADELVEALAAPTMKLTNGAVTDVIKMLIQNAQDNIDKIKIIKGLQAASDEDAIQTKAFCEGLMQAFQTTMKSLLYTQGLYKEAVR